MSYLDPGLIAIGEPRLRSWLAQEPALEIYSHYIDNLFRRQAHVRSAEVEGSWDWQPTLLTIPSTP